jgi:hypothetical protein
MNMGSRSLCALTILVLLFTAPVWACWLRSVGINVGDLPAALQWLDRESERKQELSATLARCSRLHAARQRVLEDLAYGRLPLLEATRRWRDLSPVPQHIMADLLRVEPGLSDGERLCRHTIQRIEIGLNLPPEEARQVVARLEAELQEHLARHGTVVLPEPRPSEAYSEPDGPGR